jgi:hypothetical protein
MPHVSLQKFKLSVGRLVRSSSGALAENNTYRLANTPTEICLPLSGSRKRSGFHSSASGPQTSGKLPAHVNSASRVHQRREALPIIGANVDFDTGAFLDRDRRNLLTRLGGDREGQRDHIVAFCFSSEERDDRVQPHRLLRTSVRDSHFRVISYSVTVPSKRPKYMPCYQDQ